MALVNLVRVVSATTGTGALTLGLKVQGFLNMVEADAVDGETYSYAIEADYVSSVATSREQGTGVWDSGGNTLTRNVINSTNSDALLNLAGDEQVIITPHGGNFIAIGAEPAAPKVGTLWEDVSGDVYEWSDVLGWDPVRTNAAFTLSADHLTLESVSAFGYYSAFSSASKASGKFVFAIELVSGGGAQSIAIGVGNSVAQWGAGSYIGAGGNEGISAFDDGAVFLNNINVVDVEAFAAGDIVTVAVDRSANLLWFRTNAGDWNNSGSADPATGTGGISIAAIAGSLSAGISTYGAAEAVLDVAPAGPPSGFGYLDTTGWMGIANPHSLSPGETLIFDGDVILNSYASNTYVGAAAGNQQAGPFSNIALGNAALQSITGAQTQNVAVGSSAAVFLFTGNYNTFVGSLAGSFGNGGDSNTGLGVGAMLTVTGDANVAVGGGDNITSGNRNICIGNAAEVPTATASHQLSLANYIYGTGLDGTGTTISDGKIGLGIKAPVCELDVDGCVRAQGYTIASTLPAAGVAGRRAYVTDSAASPVFGATISGGGSVVVPVFDNGTNWIYG